MKQEKTVFTTATYRPFLAESLRERSGGARGALNKLATYIGVHPSLISQVLSETKHLSLEQAQLTAEYLGLTVNETECFLLLVQYERAGTTKLKAYFEKKLNEVRRQSKVVDKVVPQERALNETEKAIFYSHWLYAAVWLLTSLPSGQTTESVAAWAEVSRERAAEVLRFLTETNLCVHERGVYRMGPQSVHLERSSPFLYRHLSNWRLRAIDRTDKLTEEELMYTAPLSISARDFQEIRSRLVAVIKEVTDTAVASPAEKLACFNLDFFWLGK